MNKVYDPRKIEILEKIYALFDRSTQDFSLACREGCDDCCTCNVTATGLEIIYLFSQLEKSGIEAVKERVGKAPDTKRYRVALTTNGFARAAMAGEPVEEEENDPAWGRCPLLVNGRCSIYHARPFGCRSMMSQAPCREAGWAQMPPLALTLSTVVLQYIEHLDAGGISGNFLDMALMGVDRSGPGDLPFENMKDSGTKEGFVRNLEIPALMVPPEHRSKVAPLVRKLNALMTSAVPAKQRPDNT